VNVTRKQQPYYTDMKKRLQSKNTGISHFVKPSLKIILSAFLVLLIEMSVMAQGFYPDPKTDIPSTLPNSNVTVTQLIEQFNKARQTENTQLGTSLAMITAPPQAEWDALNQKEQLFWILNQERQLRALKPLEQLSTGSLNTIAQSYGDLMLEKQQFSHTVGGTTPWDRMSSDPAIKNCNQSMGENLYISWNFQYNNHGVTDALYTWLYDDAGSAWGHRRILLKTNYNDDSGQTGREGIIGLGVAKGVWGTWQATTVVVYDVFDPCSSWNFNTGPQAPVASITSPANNSTFTTGSTITINANASDADGNNTIASVTFYANDQPLGTDTTSPYSYTWNNVADGSYKITAIATDNTNLTGTSAAITVSVSNQPVISDITNAAGTITAQYSDSPAAEGITKVIDNSSSTKYLTFHNAGWIQFQSSGSHVVTKYSITSANDAAQRDPLNWTFQGSTNGTSWTTLDTRNNQDFPSRFQRREFLFTNTTAYSYYRLQMTNNSGSILQLAEWEIFGIPAQSVTLADAQKPVALESSDTFLPYPNPSNGIVNIVDGSKAVQIQLIDLNGNLIKAWSNLRESTVDVSGIKPGTYWLRVFGKEHKRFQQLVIE
jgi:hypothetical protein